MRNWDTSVKACYLLIFSQITQKPPTFPISEALPVIAIGGYFAGVFHAGRPAPHTWFDLPTVTGSSGPP
jgi:hypothetical protein